MRCHKLHFDPSENTSTNRALTPYCPVTVVIPQQFILVKGFSDENQIHCCSNYGDR